MFQVITRSWVPAVVVAVAAGMIGGSLVNRADAQKSFDVLEIDVENITTYIADAPYASLASREEPVPTAPKAFANLYGIGDIVAVNAKPARGTWSVFTALNLLAPASVPGIALADTFRGGVAVTNWEILNPDFSPRGTVMAVGLAGGPALPFSGVSGMRFGNLAVVGGTGEFVGVRGVSGEPTDPLASFRFASTAEDPSLRRQVKGGKLTFIVTLIR